MIAQAQHPPLPLRDELPVLDPARVATGNGLARAREPIVLPSRLGPLALRPQVPGGEAAAWAGRWVEVAFACASRAGRLWAPADLLPRLVTAAYPEVEIEALDPEALALVVQAIEAEAIAQLGAAARGEITLIGIEIVERAPDAPLHLEGRLESAFPVLLVCHPIERERMLKAFARRAPQRRPFPELTATIGFRCGHTALALADYAALEVGSGIVLDDTTLGFQKIMAVLGERFVQSCAWQTIKPVLDGPLTRHADPATILYTANGHVTNHPDTPGAGSQTGGVGDVPIHLVFELGRTEMPVADLESLQAGYVFDLAKPLSQSVEILANGRRIGSGELVRVGEAIGVRVTRLVR